MAKIKTKKNEISTIFISWSGNNSRIIANRLKQVIEKDIFNSKIKCFVSDSDIASGTDWWNKIKDELKSSKLGILCITKENIQASWIYYEAGALVGNDVPTTPLLFNCSIKNLEKTPLTARQCIDFGSKRGFLKMISDINDQLKILDIPEDSLKLIADKAYQQLKIDLKETFDELKNMGYFDASYIYPSDIKTINRNTIFISAPMSKLSDDQYIAQCNFLLKVKQTLTSLEFSKIICPAITVKDKLHFDGDTKAMRNFKELKQVDCYILIYDKSLGSSILIELGYAIALSKKIVVFYKGKLPYLIEKAGENIQHIKTYKFKNYDSILEIINSNGQDLFNGNEYE